MPFRGDLTSPRTARTPVHGCNGWPRLQGRLLEPAGPEFNIDERQMQLLRAAFRPSTLQGGFDLGMHELRDVAAEAGDLAHQGRRNEVELFGGCQEHVIDTVGQVSTHGRELMSAGDACFAGAPYLIGVDRQRQYEQRHQYQTNTSQTHWSHGLFRFAGG